MADLKDLLPDGLKQGLTKAEERLLEVAQVGEEADFSNRNKEVDNPDNANNWGPERTIRAKLLYWLFTNAQTRPLLHAKGIQIKGARITGCLDFESATLHYPFKIIHCSIMENVILKYAETRTLDFSQSSLKSILAEELTTKGDVILSNVKAKGEVLLLGANISGDLICNGATFENPNGYAFSTDGITVKGSLFLKKVIAKGEVRLLGADIGSNLECEGATFENAKGCAFNADSITVKESLFFKNITANGEVRLLGANIGNNLECIGATFENAERYAFLAENVRISSALFLHKLKKFNGYLNLSHARVGQLQDDEASWPCQGKIILDGFEYGAFSGDTAPETADKRIKWLRLQSRVFFSTQPYEQLAKVFRQSGRDSDAKTVLIAKQDDLRRYGALSRKAKSWNWFLGITIGHGYQPLKVIFRFILPILVLGSIMFCWADNLGVMQPSKERVYLDESFKKTRTLPSEYPQFVPLIYSIDLFVPFVDFHQEDYWLPDATKPVSKTLLGRPYGFWFRIYFWLHISFGWVFSTIAVASLTGLIRKE